MGWDWKPSSPSPVTYSSSKSQPAKGLQTEQPTRPSAQIHEPMGGHFLFKPLQNLIKWKLLILPHIKGLMGLEGEPGSLRWETTEGLKHQIKWIYFSPCSHWNCLEDPSARKEWVRRRENGAVLVLLVSLWLSHRNNVQKERLWLTDSWGWSPSLGDLAVGAVSIMVRACAGDGFYGCRWERRASWLETRNGISL